LKGSRDSAKTGIRRRSRDKEPLVRSAIFAAGFVNRELGYMSHLRKRSKVITFLQSEIGVSCEEGNVGEKKEGISPKQVSAKLRLSVLLIGKARKSRRGSS